MSVNNENLNGIILMTLAMLAFAIDDMFLKLLTSTVPIGQSMFLMGVGSSLVFYVLVKKSGGRIFDQSLLQFPMLLRNTGDLIGTFGIFIAIALIPLTTVVTIMMALPLLVILAAVFFLNEKVGLKRWVAVLSGILGMLLVVKPGTEAFNLHTLFAVIGVIGMTARDIGSRMAPKSVKSEFMAFYASVLVIPLGIVIISFEQEFKPLTTIEGIYLVFLILIGTFAYHAMTIAVRMGDISAIAPVRYTRLFFAMIIGLIIFNEEPDFYTIIGAGIIVISGLYAFLRELKSTTLIEANKDG